MKTMNKQQTYIIQPKTDEDIEKIMESFDFSKTVNLQDILQKSVKTKPISTLRKAKKSFA